MRAVFGIDCWTNATRARGTSVHRGASVHVRARVCVFLHQPEAFWTGPRVKGSANTLSLSAARVITPG